MLSDNSPHLVRPAFSWNEFGTLDAAITDAKQALMAQTSGEEIETISGEIIESISYSDTQATFHLTQSRSVILNANPHGVDWSICNSDETPQRSVSMPPRQLSLRYSLDKVPHEWARASLLERRIAHKFVSIVRYQHDVFFYAQNCPVLLFGVLTVVGANSETLLLSWDDAE
ncbi:hypothetical protein CA54_39300 [Symmachiella macrocystis]|uniref:Uncharacterized protein n=1 Tax=Symmachiella macrocystis TaxID=2527985 RepID=A0A5C6BE28_9PLAN|nr:hypothetical protein CA54_39300 [Symmachiella macrocystis]